MTVEFNVTNQYFPEGKTSYVTVAEIPGTDKADEVVMLGGHLDSWTSATGATDNAIGCAIMMEAARILKTVGAKPRRTIRVALWSGEEEGLLGSFAYVKEHFGSAEAPAKDFDKLDAYWNIDDGTGRVRGASIFGPPGRRGRSWRSTSSRSRSGAIYGALPSTARVEGGSDNGAFAVAGLPGIGTQQDNIEYNSTTWHTNLDTYERIVPEDVMHNAVITASVMLHLANRDQMLPRFAADGDARGAGRTWRWPRWRSRWPDGEPARLPRVGGETPDRARAGIDRRQWPRRCRGKCGHDRRRRHAAGARQDRAQRGRQLRVHAERCVRRDGLVHVHRESRWRDEYTGEGERDRALTQSAYHFPGGPCHVMADMALRVTPGLR